MRAIYSYTFLILHLHSVERVSDECFIFLSRIHIFSDCPFFITFRNGKIFSAFVKNLETFRYAEVRIDENSVNGANHSPVTWTTLLGVSVIERFDTKDGHLRTFLPDGNSNGIHFGLESFLHKLTHWNFRWCSWTSF